MHSSPTPGPSAGRAPSAPETDPALSEVPSASPSASSTDDQLELLAHFRADWDFQPILEQQAKATRAWFIKYFAKDAMYSVKTLKAFKTLARLVPTDVRNAKAQELFKVLQNRQKGHGGRGYTIGKNDAAKDKILVHEVKRLIKGMDGEYTDSDDRADHGAIGETQPDHEITEDENPQPAASQTLEKSGSNQINEDSSDEEQEHDPVECITAIGQNWLSRPLPDLLPRGAYPPKSKNAPLEWPPRLLKALADLSEITSGRDQEVHARLGKAFTFRKTHNLDAALRHIQSVHDDFHEETEDTEPSEPVNNGASEQPTTTPPQPTQPTGHLTATNPNTTPSSPPSQPNDTSRAVVLSQKRTNTQPTTPPVPPPKRIRTARTAAPALSPAAQHRHRLAVLTSRSLSSALVEAEVQLDLARQRRTNVYASTRQGDVGGVEVEVGDARVQVERRRMAVLQHMGVVAGVVVEDRGGEEDWEETDEEL